MMAKITASDRPNPNDVGHSSAGALDAKLFPEIHIFVVWPRAFHAIDRIAEDIRANFTLKEVVDLEWSPECFARNLERFYSLDARHAIAKERECGRGTPRAYIIQDNLVRYEYRHTTKGFVLVNSRMFDARQRYRDWAGGGFLVHGSLSRKEAQHDICLLLDTEPAAYSDMQAAPASCTRRSCADPAGAHSWESFQQLARALDVATPWVLLFGETDGGPSSEEELRRLVLLAENRWDMVLAVNGRPAGRSNGRLFYEVLIAGQAVWFDLRQIGEGYFDPQWERDILMRRTSGTGIPIADAEDRRWAARYELAVRNNEWLPWLDHGGTAGQPDRDLDCFLHARGYCRVTLKPPAVSVPGEKLPLKWRLFDAMQHLRRLASSVKQRGLARSIRIAARQLAEMLAARRGSR